METTRIMEQHDTLQEILEEIQMVLGGGYLGYRSDQDTYYYSTVILNLFN